jgi:deoxyribose-phosphate aldolase
MDNIVSKTVTARDIAKMIDHSLLNPKMTRQEVEEGCELAKEYDCASVCVKPCDVEAAYEILQGSDVIVSTVVGFPHGANLTEIKVMEAELAIDQGCRELDMVLNIGRLRSGDCKYVEKDIKEVCDVARRRSVKVKVIFENFYLTDEEKIKACQIAERAGASWVKTSTGYAGGGATIHDLKLMRANCSPSVQVKAAGGVRTLDAALAVRAVGGTRFGATATKAIIEEARQREADGTLKLPDEVTEL